MTIDYSYRAKYYTPTKCKKLFIPVHYTANIGTKATARGNANYFANCDREASAHYVVDEGDIAYNCVPEDEIAYAVGGTLYPATTGGMYYGKCTNANSISIEMVSQTDDNGNYFIPQKTIDNCLELVKDLQKRHNIPNDHVIRHFDVNGKPCPMCWTNLYGYSESPWADFNQRLEENIVIATPIYRVQVGAFNSYYYAENYKLVVEEAGFKDYKPFTTLVNGQWKVQVGAFHNKDYAYDFRNVVREAGFKEAFIRVE